MAKLIPILRYRNPAAAIDWLERALGFTRHFVAEEGGRIVHAQLLLGEAMLMLGPDHDDDPYGIHSPLALDGTNQCVYLALDCAGDGEVDTACARAGAAGAAIVTAPYGSREFSCRDPEGHVWSVGSYAGEPVAR